MSQRATVIAVLVAVLLGFLPVASFAQVRVCPWSATNTEPVRTRSNNIVEWGSTADPAGMGLWNLASYVINLDKGGPRNIDWEAAGIRVEALRPQHYASLCHHTVQGRSDRTGPLYFARDQSSMATSVYWGGPPPTQKETVAGKPLTLSSEFIVYARDTKSQRVSVRVTTTLIRTSNDYQIVYTIENLSENDVVVDFPIDPDTAAKMGEGKVTLKKGEKRRSEISTTTFPGMIRFPVRVSEPSKEGTSAIINVPTARRLTGRG